jgi:hypothetical protein
VAARILASVVGLLALAEAVLVAAGMVSERDPEFERGTSPTWTVVLQETLGAITLLVLVVLAYQLPRVARGRRLGTALALLLSALVLGVFWWFSIVLERAS